MRKQERACAVACEMWDCTREPTVVVRMGPKQFEAIKAKNLKPEHAKGIVACFGISKQRAWDKALGLTEEASAEKAYRRHTQ